MKNVYCLIILLLVFAAGGTEEKLTLSLPLLSGMSRADLHFLKPTGEEKAVLILCPGHNGNGRFFLEDQAWVEFARKNQLGLVGLAFMSKGKNVHSRQFYYYAENGTGKLLLRGLKKIYGSEIPILLYGFSGGAHFVSRFVEWNPKRVAAWCAYSAGWWDKPKNSSSAPGIIACGENDERLQASLNYFWDGREQGKPWLWIELKETGHVFSLALESFVRDFFYITLQSPKTPTPPNGVWVNIYKRQITNVKEAEERPCATAWLPHRKLYIKWLALTPEGE